MIVKQEKNTEKYKNKRKWVILSLNLFKVGLSPSKIIVLFASVKAL